LVTNDMTPQGPHTWDDIDPTVFTEKDGTSWLIWGNAKCYIAKLKPNMIELDGPIGEIDVPRFEEAPWIHKRGNLYYLTYASIDRSKGPDERIAYATAPAITGPWTYRGELTGPGKNSFTIHPGIAEFKGNWYFFYHDASLTIGEQKGMVGRRAVRVEHLYYNPDGTIRPIVQTDAGITAP
jgi:beta-xylosidase